jgi:hypothetical protein
MIALAFIHLHGASFKIHPTNKPEGEYDNNLPYLQEGRSAIHHAKIMTFFNNKNEMAVLTFLMH